MTEIPENVKALLPECPYCDEVIEVENAELNMELVCPHCGSKVKLVSLDGVWLFMREGWL